MDDYRYETVDRNGKTQRWKKPPKRSKNGFWYADEVYHGVNRPLAAKANYDMIDCGQTIRRLP